MDVSNSDLAEALDMAGFFVAHAIWSVYDGDPFIPELSVQLPDGSRTMIAFADSDGEATVEFARTTMEKNEKGGQYAVLIFDGFITLGDWRTDALFIDICSYSDPAFKKISMAIPYKPKSKGFSLLKRKDAFAIYRPKILSMEGTDESAISDHFEAFFDGISKHEKGAEIWEKYFGESR